MCISLVCLLLYVRPPLHYGRFELLVLSLRGAHTNVLILLSLTFFDSEGFKMCGDSDVEASGSNDHSDFTGLPGQQTERR